jgi:hypothetical protein
MVPYLLTEQGISDDWLLTLSNIKGWNLDVVYMLSGFHSGECSDYDLVDCCTV